jgi:hypothetical protein
MRCSLRCADDNGCFACAHGGLLRGITFLLLELDAMPEISQVSLLFFFLGWFQLVLVRLVFNDNESVLLFKHLRLKSSS